MNKKERQVHVFHSVAKIAKPGRTMDAAQIAVLDKMGELASHVAEFEQVVCIPRDSRCCRPTNSEQASALSSDVSQLVRLFPAS